MHWIPLLQNTLRGLLGESMIFFALAAMGLNLHFGYTGLLNFGQAVFMASGAYGLAMTVVTLGPLISWWPESFWFGVFIGVVVFPLVLALIMGIPTLRLRADYFAIVTIAVSEMFRLIMRSPKFKKWTNSSDGLTGFSRPFYDLSPFSNEKRYFFGLWLGNQMWIVLVGWVLVSAVLVWMWLLIRSPWGRVLKAIREDEDAARSLGKNVYSYKMQALILGGMLGALGGMMRGIGLSVAQPDGYTTDVTFFVWVALILGGAGVVFGPVIGSGILWAILTFTDTLLYQLTDDNSGPPIIPKSVLTNTQVGQVRFMMIGVLLILLAAFRPQGIFGNKEEMSLEDR